MVKPFIVPEFIILGWSFETSCSVQFQSFSDGRVSNTEEFWKLQRLFVKIKSIQEGFSGFLHHLGSVNKLSELKVLQNTCMWLLPKDTQKVKKPHL